MAGHSTEDVDSSTKVSSGSESGARKLTLSCSRCRSSKLKCDRNDPCMECVKRNVGHLCTKDERQPRAKRAKTDHKTKTNEPYNQGTDAEEAAQVLENFVDGTSRNNAYLSSIFDPAICSVAPDYPNMYWLTIYDPRRQVEKLTLIREIVDAMPETDLIYLLFGVFITRCQSPLGNAIHTPTFMKQAEMFCDCLRLALPEDRVTALSSQFSMETLACHLLALVLALAIHPTPALHGWFPTPLTLRVEELRASNVHSKTWRSLAISCLRGDVSFFCGSIASLQAATMILLDGQEDSLTLDAILVTAISGAQKLGLHQLGDARLGTSASPTSCSDYGSSATTEPPYIRTEVGIRIWWALVMRDWSRGQALGYYNIHPSQFNTRIPLHINDDDLCQTTLKVDGRGHIIERPRSEFTMLSYTVHALEIAVFARDSIDLRAPLRRSQEEEKINEDAKMRNHLNKKYERFIAGLPSYFRLGSTVGLTSTGPTAAIPVHRWMLHQQLWSVFLRLHRTRLSSQDGRASCRLLAHNIIGTQAHIQARCTVCGSLSTSETQVFNAAIVLLVDLLLLSKHKDSDRSSAQLSRLMTRDKIQEAIELLQTQSGAKSSSVLQDHQWERVKASVQRGITALEALMKLEEEESYGNNEESDRTQSTREYRREQGLEFDSDARTLLRNKVIDILRNLQGDAKHPAVATEQESRDSSFSDLDLSMLSPTAFDGFQELDVLPVLSNNPSHNFGQFLDFALPLQLPLQDSSATADSQTVIDSMTLNPSSGIEYPLHNFSTPAFPDVYDSN